MKKKTFTYCYADDECFDQINEKLKADNCFEID